MTVMDLVTLYVILTMADGTPRAWQSPIAVEMCEKAAETIRRRQLSSLAWCATSSKRAWRRMGPNYIDVPRPVVLRKGSLPRLPLWHTGKSARDGDSNRPQLDG